ncbi:MAG: hypothetical protein ACI9NC_003132, partial [Verrucomicrobiales bacterium]
MQRHAANSYAICTVSTDYQRQQTPTVPMHVEILALAQIQQS